MTMRRWLGPLLWWQFRGRIRRTLRLVRTQPKYAVGMIVGLLYFGWLFARPMLSGDAEFGGATLFEGPARDFVRHALAVLLALYVGGSWLVMPARESLRLRAAELHLLLTAPLDSRRVITYTLLRRFPATLITGLALGVFLSTGGVANRLLQGVFLVMFFLLWDFHGKARNIYKPRWTRSTAGRAVVYGAAALLTAAAVERGREMFMAARQIIGSVQLEERGFSAVVDTIPPLDAGFPGSLIQPFYFLTGFRWADNTAAAILSAILALGIGCVLFLVIVRSGYVFGEGSVEEPKAGKRSRRRSKMGAKSREREPMSLPASGGPEWALLWKDLLLFTRVPLKWPVRGALVLAVLLAFNLHRLPAYENIRFLIQITGVMIAFAFPMMAGIAWKNGFRKDLFHLEAIRTWPVPATRLVLGEVLGAAVISTLFALLGLVLILACEYSAVNYAGGDSIVPERLAERMGVGHMTFLAMAAAAAAPLMLCVAFLSSALSSVSSLFLPGWFMVSDEQKGDPAAMGQRILIGIALSLCILMAFIPTILLVGGVVLVQSRMGGTFPAWELPLIGLLAAVPLAIEAALLVRLGGALWKRLDPSKEVLEGLA